uniref:Uncharacterized protein n=1 Tax=Ditylenchus dipsaci TaxID=166011 RepID=A0A915DAH4_9BILA
MFNRCWTSRDGLYREPPKPGDASYELWIKRKRCAGITKRKSQLVTRLTMLSRGTNVQPDFFYVKNCLRRLVYALFREVDSVKTGHLAF